MPNFKHVIKVNREEEKRLYRIMKELETKGETIIDGGDSGWNGTMRKFGIRSKPLIEQELIDPIWIQLDNQSNKVKKRMIRTKDVDVSENMGIDVSFFHFKKRKIV